MGSDVYLFIFLMFDSKGLTNLGLILILSVGSRHPNVYSFVPQELGLVHLHSETKQMDLDLAQKVPAQHVQVSGPSV